MNEQIKKQINIWRLGFEKCFSHHVSDLRQVEKCKKNLLSFSVHFSCESVHVLIDASKPICHSCKIVLQHNRYGQVQTRASILERTGMYP